MGELFENIELRHGQHLRVIAEEPSTRKRAREGSIVAARFADAAMRSDITTDYATLLDQVSIAARSVIKDSLARLLVAEFAGKSNALLGDDIKAIALRGSAICILNVTIKTMEDYISKDKLEEAARLFKEISKIKGDNAQLSRITRKDSQRIILNCAEAIEAELCSDEISNLGAALVLRTIKVYKQLSLNE